MVTVEIRNFQSIEHATIVVDGFTALVGRSNIGKSAIIRAVEAALGGSSGTSFVRHGDTCARRLKDVKACKCVASVHIKATGFDLLWEKGDSVNRYVYNGTVYDSVARGFPEFLQEDFKPVKVGDKSLQLQVASQWEPIFLLNASGGVVADVLSDVAHLQRINVALDLSEKDRREAVAGHKARVKDATSKETELKQYVGLDAAMTQARAVEARMGDIAEKEQQVQEIEAYLEALRGLAARLKVLSVGEATAVPAVGLLSDSVSLTQALASLVSGLESRSLGVHTFASVETVAVPDVSQVKQVKQAQRQVSDWKDSLCQLEAGVSMWDALEAVPVPEQPDLRSSLDALSSSVRYLRRKLALEEQLDRLERDHFSAETAEQKSLEAVRALGACPTCTRPFEGTSQ